MSSSKNSKTSKLNSVATSTSHFPSASHSAEIIASNDDLLYEILLRLPIKSLLKFKSISKHWLFLISNQKFSIRRCTYPASASGLFLSRPGVDFTVPRFNFADLNSTSSASFLKSIAFTNDVSARSGIRIIQSCNGLFLCGSSRITDTRGNYYVYNPTTKHYARLPRLKSTRDGLATIRGLALAFDPSKSHHYKVVCVRSSNKENNRFHFLIFSSDTFHWRLSSQASIPADFQTRFDQGVFWNGSVHWITPLGKSSPYFKVEEDRLCEMPMPPIPDHLETVDRSLGYFGESLGHFHFVDHRQDPGNRFFNVYEIKNDYSKWFIKYRVDVSVVSKAFPEILPVPFFDEACLRHYRFSVLCVVRCKIEEDSYLVMSIPRKVLRFNLKRETFCNVCHIDPISGLTEDSEEDVIQDIVLESCEAYQYIESLACVRRM